ncbi:hypothetical protein LTS18_005727, partial [Coniosporium uncinatum]
ITPHNYLLGDPSRETVNMVRVNYDDGSATVETFGQGQPMCSLDVSAMQPDLSDYKGDSVVRKFPYEPNDPYYETDSIV